MDIINYDEILFLIKNELIETMEDKYEYFKDYEFVIDLEQNFVKNYDRENDNHKIFIVVSFEPTEIIFGQTAVSFTLKVMSEQNSSEISQTLLMDFATKFNLHWNDEKTIYQIINTPSISSNFELVHEGFRSILVCSGMFLIGKDANPYNLKFFSSIKNNWEDVPVITFQTNFDNSLDSQPFFNSQNFVKSRAKFGTLSINFTFYLVNNELSNKILDIVYRKIDNNTTFKFKIEHLYKYVDDFAFCGDFKLVNMTTQKVLDDFQMLVVTFML